MPQSRVGMEGRGFNPPVGSAEKVWALAPEASAAKAALQFNE